MLPWKFVINLCLDDFISSTYQHQPSPLAKAILGFIENIFRTRSMFISNAFQSFPRWDDESCDGSSIRCSHKFTPGAPKNVESWLVYLCNGHSLILVTFKALCEEVVDGCFFITKDLSERNVLGGRASVEAICVSWIARHLLHCSSSLFQIMSKSRKTCFIILMIENLVCSLFS